ncbi:MAG: flap endonuclease [Deltaproteobacteria bacterium]|nr:flap endonuclease [Deltaproteobacteria bacterium]
MRLHVVDGTFELYRAHFAPRPGHADRAGHDVKATVGVMASLVTLLRDPDEAVTHLAVAFDNPIRSFRNDLYDGYKSDEGVPPELRAQFDLVEEAVRALGITAWSMQEFEADDALAAAAHRFAPVVEQVRLLTPDKDLGQCLQGTHVVQVDRIRRRVIDEDALRARRGITPAQVPDWLGLVGDSADGFPGLPGFGEKTATALLQAFGTLERIPADAAAWPAGIRGAARLATTLAEQREDARLYRRLATLRTDAPVDEDLEALRWRGPRSPALDALCARLAVEDPLRGVVPRSGP